MVLIRIESIVAFFLRSPNPSMAQPSSLSSMTHQDSPSPISSQNSTSGDDASIYMRNQQLQKKKGIRNSLGRLFTRKPGSMDQKPMHESIHQPMSHYQSHYPTSPVTRGTIYHKIFEDRLHWIQYCNVSI